MTTSPGRSRTVVGEPGRGGSRVVVVVEALAGGEERQPLEVAGGVVVRAAAEVVADGVHGGAPTQVDVDVDEGGEQPDHRPNTTTRRRCRWPVRPTRGRTARRSQPSSADVLRVAGHRDLVAGLAAVHGHVRDLHPHPARAAQPSGDRLRLSVKAWCLRCTATHWRGRMPVVIHVRTRNTQRRGSQRDRPVRQGTVQVHGGAHVGQLGDGEADQDGDEERGACGVRPYRTYLPVGRHGPVVLEWIP